MLKPGALDHRSDIPFEIIPACGLELVDGIWSSDIAGERCGPRHASSVVSGCDIEQEFPTRGLIIGEPVELR
jgi:hypothetical protein